MTFNCSMTHLRIGCLIAAIAYVFFNGNISAQVYSDGITFDYSKCLTTIRTADGWEDVIGITATSFAGFGSKARWGTGFMEGASDLVIPEKVEDVYGNTVVVGSIGPRAFQYFQGTSIYIPDYVTDIEELAFGQCVNIKKIVFGKNVKHVGFAAFPPNNLESVYFLGNTPPTHADAFLGFINKSNVIVHVPDEAISSFRADKYYGGLNIVGMDADEIKEIKYEMEKKAKFRHKCWRSYVLDLQKNIQYFQYQLHASGNSDVYDYIKKFK